MTDATPAQLVTWELALDAQGPLNFINRVTAALRERRPVPLDLKTVVASLTEARAKALVDAAHRAEKVSHGVPAVAWDIMESVCCTDDERALMRAIATEMAKTRTKTSHARWTS